MIARNRLLGQDHNRKSKKHQESIDLMRFSTGQAARISGVAHRTVDYWAKTGLVPPSIAETSGSGKTRFYHFYDLVTLRVARELRDAGISAQAMRRVVEFLRENGWERPMTQRLVAVGSDVYLVRSCKELDSVLRKPGQGTFSFMLNLPQTVHQVEKDIEQLRAA
jgi:DNA-binding transcriptional MerR regulator